VRAVYEAARIHSGEHLSSEADLMVGFEATWRVSWATSLGDIVLEAGPAGGEARIGPVFEDNLSTWSGDHVSVAEDLVRGIFFCNRKVEIPAEGVDLLHVAPTALSVVGVEVPAEYDLAPLRFLDPP